MKDAECAETNEKSIVFEIWSFKFLESSEFSFRPKEAQCSETDFLVHNIFLLRILVFEIWSIFCSTFLAVEVLVLHLKIIQIFYDLSSDEIHIHSI